MPARVKKRGGVARGLLAGLARRPFDAGTGRSGGLRHLGGEGRLWRRR
jgi:hypothetical protein